MVSTSRSRKLMTFQVAGEWYALPMAAVLKVVNCPSPSQGGRVQLGVVQLGSHMIQLLDLYRKFGLAPDAPVPAAASFLLVLYTDSDQLWGIALDTPPDLLEVPAKAIKPITPGAGFVAQNYWISDLVVDDSGQAERTLMLLDWQSAIAIADSSSTGQERAA